MIEKDLDLNVNNTIGVASSLLEESTTESIEYMQSIESIGKLKEQNLSHRTCTARSLAFLLPSITAASFRRRSPTEIQLFVRWHDVVGADIAAQTGFSDEFYLSRQFKKATGVSPMLYSRGQMKN